jgi:hypothetical protein
MKSKAVESYSCLVLSYADLWSKEGAEERAKGRFTRELVNQTRRPSAQALRKTG